MKIFSPDIAHAQRAGRGFFRRGDVAQSTEDRIVGIKQLG